MKRYRVLVARRVYQMTTIVMSGETRKEAEAAALAKSKDPGIAWDYDANIDGETSVYFVERTEEA